MKIQAHEIDWKSLERRGFLHIKDVLEPQEIATLLADYRLSPLALQDNFAHREASSQKKDSVAAHICREILPHVEHNTSIRVDMISDAWYLGIEDGINFPWHADHEAFLRNFDSFNNLNVFFIIQKPDPECSNVSLVPWDTLQDWAPDFCALAKGRGAFRAYPTKLQTLIVDDLENETYRIPVPFPEIAETPNLALGDLLLLRGDILHKTQDNKTARVAASFRAVWSKGIVKRQSTPLKSTYLAVLMGRNALEYNLRDATFGLAGQDSLTVDEYHAQYLKLRSQNKETSLKVEEEIFRRLQEVLRGRKKSFVLVIDKVKHSTDLSALLTGYIANDIDLILVPESSHSKAALAQLKLNLNGLVLGFSDLGRTAAFLQSSGFTCIGIESGRDSKLISASSMLKLAAVLNLDGTQISAELRSLCANFEVVTSKTEDQVTNNFCHAIVRQILRERL